MKLFASVLPRHRSFRGLTKILRIMKLTAIILLAFSLQVSARIDAQNVSLSERNISLQQVFKSIKRQTGYDFWYENNLLEKGQKITIFVSNKPLPEVLDLCFKDQPFTWSIVGKIIVVKEKAPVLITITAPAPAPLPPPPVDVRGRVTNEKGEPIASASVTIKGTNKGVITGANGEFAIAVPEGNKVLVISSVGYHDQDVNIGTGGFLTITLNQKTVMAEEVVVVGYGTQRQKDLTGAVSVVTNKDFNQGMVMSAQQSIQGKLSGVNISQNSGKPGGSNTVRVRGGTSLTSSNDPLYVIDGVPISNSAGVSQANINNYGIDVFDQEPTNPLMTLNPDDIESITVLKDASATAIYGARAANGVIVITTKKGSSGTSKVTVGSSVAFSKIASTLDVLSASEYRKAVASYSLPIDDKGASTDWQDKIYRTGVTQDHHFSMSGGNNKTSYRASLGYGKQQGVMLASDLSRTNARININHSALNDRLTFDLRLNYGQTFTKQAPVSNTVGSEFGTSMNYESLVFNPTYPVYDANGKYYHVAPYRVNPVSYSNEILDQLNNDRFLGNLSTTLKLLNPLSVNLNLGYTKQNIGRNSYISKNNLLGLGTNGYASVQKLEDYSKLMELTFRFKKQFGVHGVEAIAGYSWQYFVNEGDRTTATGFLSDEFKWYSLQAASSITGVNTFKGTNKLISFYSRANYNFNDRILATATLRRDGSSRFGSGNKWGMFPSGSLAWRISKEKFFQVKPVSDLKLRVSYGVTGNQEIGNLNSISTLGATSTGYIVGGTRITTVLPQQYANPNLKWEQTAQFDAGLDYSLFEGRIRGSFDYYVKKTTDLLLRIPVPSPTAVSTQLANVGSVQNKGVEIEITGKVIDKTAFKWESSFNISFNKNKVLSLSNEQFSGNNIQMAPLQGTVSLGKFAQLILPGQPLGTFWGPRFTGISAGKETFVAGADTIIGSAQPKFIFGFNNTFRYNQWSLNFLFRGSVGNDVFNLTAANMSYLSNLPGKNVLSAAVASGLARDAAKTFSSRWIEDGSFVRLDNVTLSYNVDIKKTFITGMNIFVSGQNLLMFTSYSGLDPEVNAEVSRTGMAPLGIDYLGYPRSKTISAGFNMSF